MENKEEKQIDNRFIYSSNEGLNLLTKKDYFNIFNKKDIKKSQLFDLEKAKDQIEGGLADKLSIEQIAEKHGVSVKSIKKQIKLGKKVEMEHTDDPKKAKEIARDHLVEIPDYYTRLAKMEDEAKKENKD